jgi:hypothetical protein
MRVFRCKYISLFTNATIALVTALQAMRISGEVITTPYSFVATSHSIFGIILSPYLLILIRMLLISILTKLNRLLPPIQQQ